MKRPLFTAGLVMAVVYTTASNLMEEEATTTRPSTVIPTDSQTEETEYDTWSVAEPDTDEPGSSSGSASESTGTETESPGGEYESGSENASGSEGESESELIMRRDELVVLGDDQIDIALSGYNRTPVERNHPHVLADTETFVAITLKILQETQTLSTRKPLILWDLRRIRPWIPWAVIR